MLMAVLCLGVFMASIVFFGYSKSKDTAKVAAYVDKSQMAYEALAIAAKRLQSMYANEASCSPEALETRLSNMPNLPAIGGSATIAGASSYYTAQPSLASPAKENRCTSASGKGCRQFAIPMGGRALIITANKVVSDPVDPARTSMQDCPRDAQVDLSTTVGADTAAQGSAAGAGGSVYIQRVMLTNVCSYASCGCFSNVSPACGGGIDQGNNPVDFRSPFGGGYDTSAPSATQTLTSHSGTYQALACTGAYAGIIARYYGGGFTETNSPTTLSLDDLKWARRYLETGGEDAGETNYLYYTPASPPPGNGACTPALSNTVNSATQCQARPCFPFFDLNRDGKNNEADLGILENYIRGYLTTLPVNDGLQ